MGCKDGEKQEEIMGFLSDIKLTMKMKAESDQFRMNHTCISCAFGYHYKCNGFVLGRFAGREKDKAKLVKCGCSMGEHPKRNKKGS